MSRAGGRALAERENAALPVSQQCRLLAVSRSSVYRQPTEVSEVDGAIHSTDRPAVSGQALLRLAPDGSVAGDPRSCGQSQTRPAPDAADGAGGDLPAPEHEQGNRGAQGLPVPARRDRHRAGQSVWCSDVTYIPMANGFLYLVVVMDWVSCVVLVWRLSNTLGADFCVEALEEALSRYGPPEIFNTDQGRQFASDDFTGTVKDHGIMISMDGKSRCMDNIFLERPRA